MSRINCFLESSHLLQRAFGAIKDAEKKKRMKPTRLYYTFILVFAQRFLCDAVSSSNPIYQFETCRQAAYATTVNTEIFKGFGPLQINMEWLLQVANFWRYHLNMPVECTLWETFASLSAGFKPKQWRKKLKNGAQKLGRYWNGVYG